MNSIGKFYNLGGEVMMTSIQANKYSFIGSANEQNNMNQVSISGIKKDDENNKLSGFSKYELTELLKEGHITQYEYNTEIKEREEEQK